MIVFLDGDVNGLARTGEEWNFVELCFRFLGPEQLPEGIADFELLAECTVGCNVEYLHGILLFELILVVAVQHVKS